jgi:hypothetical protein
VSWPGCPRITSSTAFAASERPAPASIAEQVALLREIARGALAHSSSRTKRVSWSYLDIENLRQPIHTPTKRLAAELYRSIAPARF